MTPTSTSLRERKKERTRHAIADAAVQLFEARGYEATTIEDIAAAAEVSPRTFFRYFATKDEVVLERAGDITSHVHDLLAARPAGEPLLVSLRELGATLVSEHAIDDARLRQVLRLIHREPALRTSWFGLMSRIEDEVTAWAADRLGVEPTELLPQLIAATVLAARRVAMDTWMQDDGRRDLGWHLARAIDLLGSGLGAVTPATPPR